MNTLGYMKILVIGDIHLGRSFPLIPQDLIGKRNFWIRSALNNILDYVKKSNIDVVLLTGDVIENENDRFEALPILSNFIRNLTERNIPTIAIVGNHDIKALPRIQNLIPDLQILGMNEWESQIIETDNGAINIVGLSHSEKNKILPTAFRNFDDSLCNKMLFNIGLLHCTLGNAPDKYFPVKKEELLSTNIDLWLLGHIHKSDTLTKDSKYGYTGSIVGLDISETGSHGIQIIEIENIPKDIYSSKSNSDNSLFKKNDNTGNIDRYNYIKKNEQIPISPLRWENIEINISDFTNTDTEEFKDNLIERIQTQINSELKNLKSELSYTKLIGFRIILVGELIPELNKEAVLLNFNNYHLGAYENIDIFIEKIIDKTRVKLDLVKLSEQNDPTGLICQYFLKLQQVNNELLIDEFKEYIRKKTTPTQKKYINEHLSFDELEEIFISSCKQSINEFWKQK